MAPFSRHPITLVQKDSFLQKYMSAVNTVCSTDSTFNSNWPNLAFIALYILSEKYGHIYYNRI